MEYNTPLVFWAAIAAIAIVSTIFRFLSEQSRNKTMRMLAEKGHPIPPELFHPVAESYHRSGNTIRGGLILMSVGIGIAILFYAMTGGGFFDGPIQDASWLPAIGAIPFMIGFALFISALFFERRLPPRDKP